MAGNVVIDWTDPFHEPVHGKDRPVWEADFIALYPGEQLPSGKWKKWDQCDEILVEVYERVRKREKASQVKKNVRWEKSSLKYFPKGKKQEQ